MRTERGFTLIELLVVITVIMILVGLLLSGVSLVRQAQARNVTLKLFEEISVAIMDDIGREGGVPSTVETDNLAKYLVDDPQTAKLPAKVALKPEQRKGMKVLDGWGGVVEVVKDEPTTLGQKYVKKIELRSRGRKSNASDTGDDLIYLYEADSATQRAIFRIVQ